ncbi:PAS domain-containing protein [Primorskyibacter sp. 2E233]|uniref:PAS domain-containing protein n=1 Tax=Primorskyibacter sp. 2E233 TaxID=3413431 RepID=UPI003BF4477B
MIDEDALRAFNQFFSSSDFPAWLASPDGQHLVINGAFQGVSGSSIPPFAPVLSSEVLSSDDITHLGQAGAQLQRKEQSLEHHHIWLVSGANASGGYTLQPILGEDGMVAILGTRAFGAPFFSKQAGERFESAELQQAAIESIGVALWFADTGTGKLRASDGFFDLLGFAPDEVDLDASWVRGRIHPADLHENIAGISALLSGEIQRYDNDYRMLSKDGSWKWVQASAHLATPSENGDGAPVLCGSFVDISARKANEEALSKALKEAEMARSLLQYSEEAHRVSTEGGGIAPWHIDPKTGEAWWSDHFYRILGYEINGFDKTRDAFVALIHPDDVAAAVSSMAALNNDGAEEYHAKFRLKRRDGTWQWYESVARLVARTHMGLHPLICGSMRDIGEWKDQEVRLKAALSEARNARDDAQAARSIAQWNEEILRVSSESGNVVPWTRVPETEESWFGTNISKILGLPQGYTVDSAFFRTLIHPDNLEDVIKAFSGLESGAGETFAQDFRIRRADGGWSWVTSRGRRIERADKGLPYIICGSLTVIDHLKENEKRLAEAAAAADAARADAKTSEEMLRTSASCGELGPWNVCHETGECWMLDTTYQMLGYEPGDFIPNSEGWRNLIHPDDAQQAIEAMTALIDGRADVYDVEKRLRHKNGNYFWYRAIARQIDRSDQGLPPLIAGTTTRIDHLKENERRLAEAAELARRARDRLNRLADNAPGALFEFRQNADGSYEVPYFSAKLPDLLGIDRSNIGLDGSWVLTHIAPEDLPEFAEKLHESKRTLTEFHWQFRVNHPQTGQRWILVNSLPMQQPDGSTIWFGNLFDITDQLLIERKAQEAAKAVKEAHARLSTIADNAPAGIFELHRDCDGKTGLRYISARLKELFGMEHITAKDFLSELLERIAHEDQVGFQASMERSRKSLTQWSHRFRVNHPKLGTRWLAGSATPKTRDDGSVTWIGTLHDVTRDAEREAELRKAHELAERMRAKSEWQAFHDSLTELPNRRLFDRALAERLENTLSKNGPRDCVLIRIDGDRFKYINDTLGHEAGDEVLKRIGEILVTETRDDDLAARIGGDEFSILLAPGTTTDKAKKIVARIQDGLSKPMAFNGRQCQIEASFGIAYVDDLRAAGSDILPFADAALYRAKEKGRNRLELFTPELKAEILNDRQLAGELQDALNNDEFIPYFQPQICANTGQLSGIETLLRWQHPTRGILGPDHFLKVAGQLRMVPELDGLMLRKAKTSLQNWRRQGIKIPKIGFNVSSGRMRDPSILTGAESITQDGTKVAFELLESILLEEENDIFRFHLDQLREAGIDIEIDDFGSGHASIIALMAISPSALKIDRRLIQPVDQGFRAQKMVRAIVEIAETFEIETIAEGVETPEQVEILRDLGCDILQGYHYSRPVSEADLAVFVRKLSSQTRQDKAG